MRSVLVTRPQPAADDFASQLRQAGYYVYVAPLMEYVPLDTDTDDLASCEALVFTSAYTVQAFTRLSRERHLPVLAVGDKTAETATKAGFLRVHSARGDSEDVIALLKEKTGDLGFKKILHPCSEDTPPDIVEACAKFNLQVVHWPIYKARFIDTLPAEVERALKLGAIDTVTLFSARTADQCLKILQPMPGVTEKLEAVCISGRVGVEANRAPWRLIRIAHHPDSAGMLDALRGNGRIFERRRAEAPKDMRGNVYAPNYTGPDRRRGETKRRHDIILHERMMIVRRMAITFVCVTTALLVMGGLLLAPEYVEVRDAAEKQGIMSFLHGKIDHLKEETATAKAAAVHLAKTAFGDRSLPAFADAIGNMNALVSTPEGAAAVGQSLDAMRAMIAETADDPAALNAAVADAKKRDPALNQMLGRVGSKDLAAGAMLLTLNAFRENVDNSRPYAKDLALLRRVAGNDPGVNAALDRLAPYAEHGVMNQKKLKEEFGGLAKDIVLAKLAGQDISVQEQALKRLDKLSQAASAKDIQGQDTEAAVARAQVLLQQGDVKAAMAELNKLDAQSAHAAEPWMENASDYVTADEASNDAAQGIMQAVSGASSAGVSNLVDMLKSSLGGTSSIYGSSYSKPSSSGAIAP